MAAHHGHNPTEQFTQSGFDLVERLYDPKKQKVMNYSMQDCALNGDLDETDLTLLTQKCDNCEGFRKRLLESRKENAEMRIEMQLLTDKLDNIRRLQEVGMLNSFRKLHNKDVLTHFSFSFSHSFANSRLSHRGKHSRRRLAHHRGPRNSV